MKLTLLNPCLGGYGCARLKNRIRLALSFWGLASALWMGGTAVNAATAASPVAGYPSRALTLVYTNKPHRERAGIKDSAVLLYKSRSLLRSAY
jgi:hypothetical protein